MKKTIVIDSNVIGIWLFGNNGSAKRENAKNIIKNSLLHKHHLIQPSLSFYETVNMIRTQVKFGVIDEQQAIQLLVKINKVPIEYINTSELNNVDILHYSNLHNLTSYDASFFQLAYSRGYGLITDDKDIIKLKNKFNWIKELKDYSIII